MKFASLGAAFAIVAPQLAAAQPAAPQPDTPDASLPQATAGYSANPSPLDSVNRTSGYSPSGQGYSAHAMTGYGRLHITGYTSALATTSGPQQDEGKGSNPDPDAASNPSALQTPKAQLPPTTRYDSQGGLWTYDPSTALWKNNLTGLTRYTEPQ